MNLARLIPLLTLLTACAEPRFEGTAADPNVKVPVVPYESVLATYKSLPEEKSRPSWRELNDEAGRLRGHEGQLADPPPPPGQEADQPPPFSLERDDSGLTKDAPPADRTVERERLPVDPPKKAN